MFNFCVRTLGRLAAPDGFDALNHPVLAIMPLHKEILYHSIDYNIIIISVRYTIMYTIYRGFREYIPGPI